MDRKFLFLLPWAMCVALCSQPVSAQQGPSHIISLGFGGSDYHIKDVHASPLIFRGVGIAPTVQYYFRGENTRQSIEGSYFHGTLETSSDNFQTSNWRGRFRYAYHQSIGKFNVLDHPVELFVGGSLQSFFSKGEYYFTVPPSGALSRSIVSWYWSHSLDAAGFVEYTIGPREFLNLQLSVPLVSNVARPQYSSSGDYNYDENDWKIHVFGKTEIIPKNLSLDILFIYQRPLAGALNIALSYEFSGSSYDTPSDVAMYMNTLRLGVSLCL